jgi:putative oxidoreductase
LGGALLIFGYHAEIIAAIMFLWLIPVTIVMHALPGGPINQIMVLKNLSIMGGLLMVAVQGAGGWSIDASRTASA